MVVLYHKIPKKKPIAIESVHTKHDYGQDAGRRGIHGVWRGTRQTGG